MRRRATHTGLSLLSALALLTLFGTRAAADTSAAPPPPSNLAMLTASGGPALAPGGWIAGSHIRLRFDATLSTGSLTPEVEIEPSSVPFKDQPNVFGPRLTSSGSASVVADGLADGQTYHWQARVIDTSGLTSPWVIFAAPDGKAFDFGVDQDAPSRPVVQSPTNPDQSHWYRNQSVLLRWAAIDSLSGIKGYSVTVQRAPQVAPPGRLVSAREMRLGNLSDGMWFVGVRAVDQAGNWSPVATFRIQLDRQAPHITWLSPSRFTFNPYRGPASVKFRVSEDASVQLALYHVGDRKPVQVYSFKRLPGGRVATITWSGKAKDGKPVSAGYYFFATTAIDRASNIARVNLGGIAVSPQQPYRTPSGQVLYPGDGKRIIVSLSRQTLYAYDGVRLVLQTFVTTGNPSLPTPPGTYTVLGKYHPYEFISPWPQGSPYWYPPSWSQYAMLFREGGYFLHDAPWRSTFGPGTNGPGQPGSNFGGTHGCVNIPPGPMLFLWNWTPVGTSVLVVP